MVAITNYYAGNYLRLSVSIRKAQFCSSPPTDKVTIHYRLGLPSIEVPLPSRQEVCSFTVRPLMQTVADFLNHIKQEDGGIDYLAIYDSSNTRISKSTPLETLLKTDFTLMINEKKYSANAAMASDNLANIEEEQGMSRLKTMVHQLYTGLNVDEYEIRREKELQQKLKKLQEDIIPVQSKLTEMTDKAESRSSRLMWGGLAFMSIQFGFLARLTWWEYSWDIIEPVTYFVTYGTAIVFYSYYLITRKDSIEGIHDRHFLIGLHKYAGKNGIDLAKYDQLKNDIVRVEAQINLLKNSRAALSRPEDH
ncbi:Calcium uniporter protein, mitochondrial [Trichoplax sp. H2]|nr:Calcium uniporter protein, mitochondrial [Trichoplax sp. H2]|eukprot:RDD38048.1 Calcium uniporter protein, mitochondrial [Trichoplax sp. H2]